MTSGAEERKRILEECSLRGIDAAGVRKYAELIATNRGRRIPEEMYEAEDPDSCYEVVSALKTLKYAERKTASDYMTALITLSEFGILDAMIEDTVTKMRRCCPMNADVYTDILMKYYGYGLQENEYRLKQITQFGKTTAYEVRNGALLSFGIIFSAITVRDALNTLAEARQR